MAVSSDVISKLTSTLRQLSKGCNVLISEGEGAGQMFPHLIINLIPRFENDQINLQWQPKPFEEDKMKPLAESISKSIKAKQEPVKIAPKKESKPEDLEEGLVKPADRKP